MQEEQTPEKPENEGTPEKEESVSDVEPTSSTENPKSSEDESLFEEHEGEDLPAEKKNNRGCGFLILILLLLGGGSGYLYYTDQIPPQVMQWIEPLLESQQKQHVSMARPPVTRPAEKRPVTLEEKPAVKEEPIIEEKIIPPAIAEEAEHISGSPTEPISEPEKVDTDYPAKISGNATLVKPDVETPMEEPEDRERFVERAPVFSPPPPKPAEPDQPEKSERTEAVQAYLDFFESALVKIGELIKTGFTKAKDFLMQSFG